MVNSRNFPWLELKTERLHLRRVTENELDQLFRLRSDPRIMHFIQRPVAKSVEETRPVLQTINEVMEQDTGINWGLYFHQDDRLLGTIGVWNYQVENHRAELGYMLDADHHRKGIMNEALSIVLDYCRSLELLHTLEARVHPDNIASRSLLEKAGFKEEGHFRECLFFEGRYYDTVYYGIVVD